MHPLIARIFFGQLIHHSILVDTALSYIPILPVNLGQIRLSSLSLSLSLAQ